MADFFARIREFISETINELRKCSWPAREELYESTILIIVSLVVLSVFVAGVDWISRVIISYLTS